jgi:hypothetical protein
VDLVHLTLNDLQYYHYGPSGPPHYLSSYLTHPTGFLYPLPIPEWKWEVVTMDFITRLPRTNKQHDSIMVVVDKLTKATHFIPLNTTHKVAHVVDIYMREVPRLHGIPKTIVSDRDPKFTSKFWKGLFKGLGTNLNFSTTYHPQFDGHT